MRAPASPAPRDPAVQALAGRIAWGRPQAGLTAAIAACGAPDAVRAGLHLLNGDWDAAHKIAQELDSALGHHWHALVHRHEPDYANSKYWLRRVGNSPIYPRLARAAQQEGQGAAVAPRGRWDPERFTDCFAAPASPPWTRRLDELEIRALLEHCLAT
jgi:hypothetical protein